MANLHKTERKLPWLLRDVGLPSDWLGGRAGGDHLQPHSKSCVASRGSTSQLHLTLICLWWLRVDK